MAIQFLRGSADKINESTEKLLAGQPLVDVSNGRLYIGDGSTQIKDLEPINKLLPRKKFAGTFYIDASNGSSGKTSGTIKTALSSDTETYYTWMNADVIPILWKEANQTTTDIIWGYAYRVYSLQYETGDEYQFNKSYFLTMRPITLGGSTWKLYYIVLEWDSGDEDLTWTMSSALN